MAPGKGRVIDLSKRRDSRRKSLEHLFREDGRILRGYLFKRLSDESEVEDLVQEVFSRLARMPDLEQRLARGGKNRSFIITVANNLIVDMERKRATRRSYQSSQQHQADEMVNELSPEAEAVANQELSLVKAAIMKLKPTWRKAFSMSRFHHMTYQQISQEMGVGVKQVEKYITNALIELRKATRSSWRLPDKGERR